MFKIRILNKLDQKIERGNLFEISPLLPVGQDGFVAYFIFKF